MEAWGARMELRAIQRRNRRASVKTRAAGRPKGKSSYGFRYIRVVMGGKIDHVQVLCLLVEAGSPSRTREPLLRDRDNRRYVVQRFACHREPFCPKPLCGARGARAVAAVAGGG